MMTDDTSARFAGLEIDPPAAAPAPAPEEEKNPIELPPIPAEAPAMSFPFAQALPVIPAPVGMKTPQGVEMSDRMARCYGWFQARGIALTPFSTDSCVAAYSNKIATAIAEAEALPVGTEHRADLIADLTSVSHRTPAARVAGTPGAQGEKQKHVSEELIAVESADQTTGAVVYWALRGDLRLDALHEAWQTAELPDDWKPAPPSNVLAFGRAAKSFQTRNCLVRKHPSGGWQFVIEYAKDARLSYDTEGPRLFVLADGKVRLAEEGANHPQAQSVLEKVTAAYERNLATVGTLDVSEWLTKIAKKLKAVSLRDSGGVYFVPRDSMARFAAIKDAVKAASAHGIYAIPALKSSEAVAAVLDAVKREADEMRDETQAILTDELGARAAQTRIVAIGELVAKIVGYEKLLGVKLDAQIAELKALRVKLEGHTTRGAALEID